MGNIENVIKPKAKDLGDNFQVRRALPAIEKRMVGPFVFWDHMGPVVLGAGKEMTVHAHPHIGLSTITWLFSGEIMHRDSLGNEQPIKPGEVNWMTAGKGIAHSERSQTQGKVTLEGIQLWLALPKDKEDIEPNFFHCKTEDIPGIGDEMYSLKVIAGEAHGLKSPVPVYSDLFYINGEGKSGYSYTHSLGENVEGAVYVIDGNIEVEGKNFERFDLIIFKKGSSIGFEVSKDAQFMIFGGEVLPEKRTVWWNFVSTDKEKIERAKTMWTNGEFASVINETEVIPLPEF